MTRFGWSIEPSRPSPSFEAEYSEHWCTKSSNYVLGLLWPSLEPITFPCRADTLHVSHVHGLRITFTKCVIICYHYKLYYSTLYEIGISGHTKYHVYSLDLQTKGIQSKALVIHKITICVGSPVCGALSFRMWYTH